MRIRRFFHTFSTRAQENALVFAAENRTIRGTLYWCVLLACFERNQTDPITDGTVTIVFDIHHHTADYIQFDTIDDYDSATEPETTVQLQ